MKTKSKKEFEVEISKADYEEMIAEGADPEYALKPGRHVFRRGAFLERHPEMKIKKVRVNIHLDADVIDYFKDLAAKPNAAPYQTQINNALRGIMQGKTALSASDLLQDKEFIKRVAEEVKRLSR
jgi:uncharacterized protein (DUF4415 family)